jgi:hypothetical protein
MAPRVAAMSGWLIAPNEIGASGRSSIATDYRCTVSFETVQLNLQHKRESVSVVSESEC